MERIEVATRGRQALHDITDQVQAVVSRSGVQEGICTLFCPHTTAGLTLNENWDPTVGQDIGMALDEMVPQDRPYRHQEGNAPAHIKTSIVGSSHSLFVESGRLVLGSWQGVYLAEFDGPRQRRVFVKVISA